MLAFLRVNKFNFFSTLIFKKFMQQFFIFGKAVKRYSCRHTLTHGIILLYKLRACAFKIVLRIYKPKFSVCKLTVLKTNNFKTSLLFAVYKGKNILLRHIYRHNILPFIKVFNCFNSVSELCSLFKLKIFRKLIHLCRHFPNGSLAAALKKCNGIINIF